TQPAIGTSTTTVRPETGLLHISPKPGGALRRSSLCERTKVAPNPPMGPPTTTVRPETGLLHIFPKPGGASCRSSLCERTKVAPNPLLAHQPPPSARRPVSYIFFPNPEVPPVGAHSVSERRWHPTRYWHHRA